MLSVHRNFPKIGKDVQSVIPAIVAKGRVMVVVTVSKGIDKPYFDRNGVIWLKSGADKRRVNSKEELRRLFQMSDQFHADGLPVQAGPETLDKLRFRDFLKTAFSSIFRIHLRRC